MPSLDPPCAAWHARWPQPCCPYNAGPLHLLQHSHRFVTHRHRMSGVWPEGAQGPLACTQFSCCSCVSVCAHSFALHIITAQASLPLWLLSPHLACVTPAPMACTHTSALQPKALLCSYCPCIIVPQPQPHHTIILRSHLPYNLLLICGTCSAARGGVTAL